MFPARVTSESERDFTGAWADKWDSRHFFADHPPFANHAGNVVKSPLLLLLHQLSILRCDLFTYVPSDKIYRNWKCRRYVCPFHAFFIFLLCSKLLFPPFPPLSTTFGRFVLSSFRLSSPRIVSTFYRHNSLHRSKTFPLSGVWERERIAKKFLDRAHARMFFRRSNSWSPFSRMQFVFFSRNGSGSSWFWSWAACKQFDINCFEYNGERNERFNQR